MISNIVHAQVLFSEKISLQVFQAYKRVIIYSWSVFICKYSQTLTNFIIQFQEQLWIALVKAKRMTPLPDSAVQYCAPRSRGIPRVPRYRAR